MKKKKKNFVYETTVDVYDAETDKKVATFTGSLSD